MADRRRMLELALKGLKAERADIDGEITQLQNELNAPVVSRVAKAESAVSKAGAARKQSPGSRLTPAGRKKLSDLMRKRWAEKRKAKSK